MIAIVDYGLGNLASIKKMVEKVGGQSTITSDPKVIAECEKIILPGVGHFKTGIENLRQRDLFEVLQREVREKRKPILGICLGAQLLTKYSEEGDCKGLGLINAVTKKFNLPKPLKVPHMGWNEVVSKKASILARDLEPETRFYFVHSYFLSPENADDILFTTMYGTEFASALEHDGIFACQFHPEKSHKFGMRLMRNFVEAPPQC